MPEQQYFDPGQLFGWNQRRGGYSPQSVANINQGFSFNPSAGAGYGGASNTYAGTIAQSGPQGYGNPYAAADTTGHQLRYQLGQQDLGNQYRIAEGQDRGATIRQNIGSAADLYGNLANSQAGLLSSLGSSRLNLQGTRESSQNDLYGNVFGSLAGLRGQQEQGQAARDVAGTNLAGTLGTAAAGLRGTDLSSQRQLEGQLGTAGMNLLGTLAGVNIQPLLAAIQAGPEYFAAQAGLEGRLAEVGVMPEVERIRAQGGVDVAGQNRAAQELAAQLGLQGRDLESSRALQGVLAQTAVQPELARISAQGGVDVAAQNRAAAELAAMLGLQGRDIESSRALQGQLGTAGIGAQSARDVADIQRQQAMGTAGIGRESAREVAELGLREALGTAGIGAQSARDVADIQRQQALGTAGLGLEGQRYVSDQERAARELEAMLGLQATDLTSGRQLQGVQAQTQGGILQQLLESQAAQNIAQTQRGGQFDVAREQRLGASEVANIGNRQYELQQDRFGRVFPLFANVLGYALQNMGS